MNDSVIDYLEDSALNYPNKIAVAYSDLVNYEEISYEDLHKETTNFAKYLVTCGIKTNQIVSIFMPKSINSIKAIFSIMKAGGVYNPIDMNSPASRLESIFEANQSKTLIVSNQSINKAKELLNASDVEFDLINIDEFYYEEAVRLPNARISVDLAYVLYTSGSTGVPKGVMISHGAIVDYTDWCLKHFAISSEDTIANHAPHYFDISTFDIYTAFASGATLQLVPEKVNLFFPQLVSWIDKLDITIICCVPSVLNLLLQTGRLKDDHFSSLRNVIFIGEVMPVPVLRTWMEKFPHIRYTNMYGPTEITVACSYYDIPSVPGPEVKSIPIGKARANMEMYVESENGSVTSDVGVRGELLIRGRSLSDGYIADEHKTNQLFIQNPCHSRYRDLVYRTGDIVSWDENGDLIYHGRKDSQIKFRGYRIELGEIEAQIITLDEVEEVVAVYCASEIEVDSFIAAVIKRKQSSTTEAEVGLKIRKLLPTYMVPSKIVLLDNGLPTTPNGKFDRKAVMSLLLKKIKNR